MPAIADPKLKDKPQPEGADNTVKPADPEPLGKSAMAFVAASIGNTARKKKEAKPEKDNDGDAEPQLDDPEYQPPPKKKAAAPTPRPAPQQPQAIDEEKLGEAVGRSVAKAMGRDKPEKIEDLPPEVKSKLAMYARLEKQFPDKYKGHAEKFLANAKKFTTYSEKWEAEHPGQEFDDTAAEHEEFRSTLEAETEYDEDDHVSALAREIVLEERKKDREEFDKEIKPLKERVKLADAESELSQAESESANQLWKELAEEFPGIIGENNALDAAALRAANDKDPEATRLAYTAANDAAFYARELHLLDNSLTTYLGDEVITEQTPKNVQARIRAHRFLNRRAQIEEEAEVARQRTDKQGRPFVTRTQYNNLSPEERAKVWTITTKGLRYLLTRHIAEEIRGRMQKVSPADSSNRDDQSLPSKRDKPPTRLENDYGDDDKPLSPSTPIAPRLAPSRGKAAPVNTEPVSGFVLRSIRGR